MEFNDNSFQVRVVEEQGVVNNFLKAICGCKGCGITNRFSCPNSKEESDDDSKKVEDDDVEG